MTELCERVVCDEVVCVCACVCDKVVCERVVRERRRRVDGSGRESQECITEEQEPHTKMCGTRTPHNDVGNNDEG